MSEISIDLHVEFKDTETREVFRTLLASRDQVNANKESFQNQMAILHSMGINGEHLFNNDFNDCEFSSIAAVGVNALRLHLFGGVHAGSRFYEQFLPVLLQTSPAGVYALAFNDQVGEIAAYVYVDGEETCYYTGENGEADDMLFDILDQENALDLLAKMHSDGQLTMPARASEQVNGIDVSILENEELYDAQIARYLKSGIIFGVSVFFAGWLLLDYFWTSLIGGLVSVIAITFSGAFRLQTAKDLYDQEIDQMIKEDAEEMGFTEDQALALMQYLEESMVQAEESAK